jgi:hypothetical protein
VPVDATDQQILDLSTKRTGQLAELRQLADDGALSGLSPGQREVFLEKVKYPVEGNNTLKSYADAFRKKNEMTLAEHERISTLADRGANNTLTEFDTVVNQMTFLADRWNLPADNAFRVRLRQIAQEAYDERAAARLLRAV